MINSISFICYAKYCHQMMHDALVIQTCDIFWDINSNQQQLLISVIINVFILFSAPNVVLLIDLFQFVSSYLYSRGSGCIHSCLFLFQHYKILLRDHSMVPAPVNLTSVLVVYFIFRGLFQLCDIQGAFYGLPLTTFFLTCFTASHKRAVNELEAVDCNHTLALVSTCVLFSLREKKNCVVA